MARRGPDYAAQLTGTERRLLDTLLAEVSTGPAPAVRRSWRAPVLVGLAALAIVLAATSVPLLRDAVLPPAAAPGPQATASATLSELAVAAAGVPRRLGPRKAWYLHRLDVIVWPARRQPGSCRAAAVSIQTWQAPQLSPREPITARLEAHRGEVPEAAGALAGCTSVKPDPPTATYVASGDAERIWRTMTDRLVAAPLPRYADPRDYGAYRADPGAEPAQWWPAFASELASPQPGAASRSRALRDAAARGEAVPLPALTADLAGRPGVSIRVPYFVDGMEAVADLTFDADTGALLQQVVYARTATEATVYLAIGGS